MSEHIVRSSAVKVSAEESLARAQKLLAGISGGWQQAVGSALSRAAAAGKTVAAREVTQEYAISQSMFRNETKHINHYRRSGDGAVEVVFGFRGNVIPLIRFDTRIGRDGRVETRVERKSSRSTLDRAFVARMGAHTGIYERTTAARLPIEEKFGPSTPSMMYSNEDVMDKIEDRLAETFDKRIDHEISRILNGWR